MRKPTCSIKEAGEALTVGRTTINNLIAEGRLESFKLGRRRLIKTESIERLIAGEG